MSTSADGDAAIPLPFAAPVEWSAKPLRLVCTLIADGDWIELKDQGGGEDFRLLQISNIGLGQFVETGKYRWITAETFSRLRCTEITVGDVLVARMPEPTGRCWYVKELPWRAVTAVDVAIVRTDESQLNARFLSYYLNSPQCLAAVASLTTGTTRMRIRRADIGRLTVPLPPISEQRAIAEVLGALDDKIEANRRLVDLCDESWRAALKSNDRGEWAPLSDLADFINGRAFTNGASGSGRMVIRIAELKSGPGASTVYNDLEVGSEHLARPGDLLFAWSGSLTVARWYRDEAIVNQHIFKVVPKTDIPIWLIHGRILDLLEYFRGIAADKATTMGHIQRRHLDEQVLVPASDALTALDQLCTPLWRRALLAEQESLRLATLRDALLPKLLSGELRVRDAESIVGEAV
jgi:type I restriction enzyme S subunit